MNGIAMGRPMPQPHLAEETLHVLGEASAEHMAWLKRVHYSLLFPDDRQSEDGGLLSIEEDLEEKVDRLGESQSILSRLKRVRLQMHDMARQMTAQAAKGDRIDPDTYKTFMEVVEGYNAQGRQLELMLHKTLAETDPLTGLVNRRGMTRELRREWVRAARTGAPFCIAIADIDHFKCINDTHGHSVGDAVLCAVSSFFTRRLRPYDTVFRYGGEEFVFALPNATSEQALRVLERLRLLTARLPIRISPALRLTVSISIGLARTSPHDSPEETLDAADQALYQAKSSGRNRVCVANCPPLN